MSNEKSIEELIKEKFFLDMQTKYHITDTEVVYRKEVDEQLLHDFYELGDICNKFTEREAMNGIKRG